MAPLSLGSDTGGSIRQPASHCGVVGLKPTYGRVSRFGLIAFGSSLDCIGPLARTAEDAALLLSVISGRDRRDATSLDREVPDYLNECRKDLGELRLGVVSEYFGDGIDPEVKYHIEQAIDVFKAMGASVHPVALPHSRYAIAAYYIIASSEASSNLARYDGAHYGFRAQTRSEVASDGSLEMMYQKTRQEGFGAEVKRRIMLGTDARL
jgi:aspartyl-tRNA(Asn)/glutamyl-tRNA(Gln) amidotransferase subunit A